MLPFPPHNPGSSITYTHRPAQALLKRRTYVLACSEEVKTPLLPAVLTDEERAKEDELYERFLPALDSFCQPNPAVAPPPMIASRRHKLVVMQNGTALDQYTLPLREHVLGIEPLYLTVTAAAAATPVLTLGMGQQGTLALVQNNKARRVFLAVCTCVQDKHGEDTQGEGRLLLFGLDYALFQEDAGAAGAAAGEAGAGAGAGAAAGQAPAPPAPPAPPTFGAFGAAAKPSSSEEATFFNTIKPKLKLLWTGPGPASVVKQLGNDYLISTVGTTVYVYKLNPDTQELVQVNFYFAQFFVSSVSVIKNYVLVADVCNSVQFLVWREEDESLTPVSKDMDSQTVLSTAFVTDGPALGMLAGDDEGNVQVMKFDPRKVETKDGSRLLCTADFHLGSDATLLLAHSLLHAPPLPPPLPPMPAPMGMLGPGGGPAPVPPMPMPPGMPKPPGGRFPPAMALGVAAPPPLPGGAGGPANGRRGRGGRGGVSLQPFGQRLEKQAPSVGGQAPQLRTCVLAGTIDGGLGLFVPVDERTYRRLALLQQLMGMGVPTPCALNPRDYRLLKTSRFVAQRRKGVLDGALLWKFVSLDSALQDDLAAAMGVTTDAILENLLEIDLLSTFF